MLPESASKKVLEATVVAIGPGARNQVFILMLRDTKHIYCIVINIIYLLNFSFYIGR